MTTPPDVLTAELTGALEAFGGIFPVVVLGLAAILATIFLLLLLGAGSGR